MFPNAVTQNMYKIVATMNGVGSPAKRKPNPVNKIDIMTIASQNATIMKARILPSRNSCAGNIRDVDLQNCFLFAFFGHRKRRQQGREYRHRQHENSRAIEFFRRAAGVVPQRIEAFTGWDVWPRRWRVVRAQSAGRHRKHLRRVSVRAVNKHLHRGVFAARDVAAEVIRNDQAPRRLVCGEGLLGLLVRGPRDYVKTERLRETRR